MNTSDWFALAQVILAVLSVAVDILLAYIAYKVNARSKDNHLNLIMSNQNESQTELHKDTAPSIPLDTPSAHKVRKKIDSVFGKLKNDYSENRIVAKILVNRLNKLFSENTVVQTLMKNNKNTIKWYGTLSTETVIEIIDWEGLKNSFYSIPLK